MPRFKPNTRPGRNAQAKQTKVFWFFFSKKNKRKQALLFKKAAKTFFCLEAAG
jgi:hypothetical protein